ncbi:leucine-rich repeat transmembrane neuronal protein 2-like [Anopheles marshallii]|uniref:leucine-rich repeat transmembrane neuronal protein 2-like n=1 Tax=Anopheles marshallii TaxID=1521116 RepID=UPI00237B7EC6|nr:leucine-rich repeat transmembrane neuronal protein 2-like [Anopheles marshallii]
MVFRSHSWKRVLLVLIVAQFASTVHIVCEESSHCDIYETRTNADFFVHQYIPTNVDTVYYRNLALEFVNSAFFITIPPHVTKVHILQSKQLKWVQVPGQRNITHMNIAYTGLRRFDVGKNSAIAELLVADSNLLKVSSSMSNLRTTVRIEHSNCLVQVLDMGVFCDLNKLEHLNFFGNRIKHLQNSATNACSAYGSLKTIILSRNLLKTLNMGMFAPFRVLDCLTANENRVETVLGSYTTYADLQLILAKNKIKSIHLCDWNVPRMRWLELQYNNLTTVPNCLEKLSNVTDFKLAYNQISNATIESFARMDSLIYLDLSYNRMTSFILNTTRYPPNLRTLWIAGNNLTELDLTAVPVRALEVQAQENFIGSMEVERISPNVITLCMSQNPIDCSWTTLQERLNLTCVTNGNV